MSRQASPMPNPPSPTPPVVTTSAVVSSVTIKIPPFWPADPEVWFAQVDTQYTTKSITSQKTRFDHVVASLSPEYATEVRDLILKPPTVDPYTELKKQLIKRTTASEQKRLRQFFSTEELGDRTPSQLLRRMQQLLGDKAASADPSFLKELFLQRLPPNVRMVLASTKEPEKLEDLASLADRVGELATPTVSSIQTSQLSSEVEQLRAEIGRLKSLVQSLSSKHIRSPTRPRTPSPAPHNRASGLCWYHSHFGEKASKCNAPCTWSSGNGQAGH